MINQSSSLTHKRQDILCHWDRAFSLPLCVMHEEIHSHLFDADYLGMDKPNQTISCFPIPFPNPRINLVVAASLLASSNNLHKRDGVDD